MNFTDYVRLRKAEWWIRQQCKGNVFADNPPKMGTPRQELTRVRLLVDMPRHLRCEAAELMAAAAARTEGQR